MIGCWSPGHGSATELDVRFDPTDILAAPTSIAASIGVSNLDALIYEVDDGGTPLYPNDPNSPLGLVAVQDGFGELSTAGISLSAARFSAGIKDVVFIEIYDGKIDLADGPYLLEAGGVGITIPFFGDEPFDIQDANPDDGIPLFGLEKPEVSGGDLVKAAAFFFGQAVGFDLPVGQATDQFSLRDLLPLTVENVHLEFPDTNQLDTFTLAVDAQFNLYERDADGNIIIENGQPKRRGIFSALPFDPILAIGRPAASGCSTGTAIDWPELDSAEYPDIQGLTLCENGFVSAEVEADSLLSPNRQLMFKQLGPIFIGAREFPVLGVDNVAADGALYLGKIVDGQWDGNVAATFTLKDTTEANNNQVRASAVGQIVVTEGSDTGTTFTDTKLDLDWVVEASADTSWFGISDGYANFHTVLTNRTTPDIPFNLAFTSTIGPFDTGLIEIPLGDYFTLFGRAKVNPDAGPDEPFFILRQAGVTVNEAAPDTLKGLTFEAGGFGVSADFGHYFVLAAEPEDDPSTVDYDESIGAYFRVAIDDESGVPGGNIFGLPEWFPIQVTEVGIRFKGTDGTGDDLDVTLDQLGSNPTQPFLELANPANYRLIISGGLESSDAWPIRAQIKNLEIVISDLQKFIGEPCYTQPAKWGSDVCPLPFDVSSVNGISAGIDPFELGPVSIGGGFSLGVQDVVFDNGDHRQVLYAQVLGELSVADVGIGAELIITQYGPVLARLKSAVPVPIAGIIGAAVGSAFFGVGAAAGFQIGNQTGFVITGLEGALVFDAPSIDEIPNPLDILDRPEFARPKNLSPQEISSAITRIVKQNEEDATPTYTWNKGFRLVASGVLTNTNIYNMIGGRVTLGMNVGFDEATLEGLSQSAAQIFVRGDLEVLSQSLAQADIVFDASDPLNPTFNVAAGIPGSGGILSLLLPLQARIGAQLDTDGLAAGTAVAARTFLETVIAKASGYFADALDLVAELYENDRLAYMAELGRLESDLARLQTLQNDAGGGGVFNSLIADAEAAIETHHNRPAFFKFLLDVNQNQQLDEGGADDELGTTTETVIDGAFLRDRMLGQNGLPAALPTVEDVLTGMLTRDSLQLGVMASGRILTDLMQIAGDERLTADARVELENAFDTGIPALNALILELFDNGVTKAGDLAQAHFTQLASLVVDPTVPDVSGRTLSGDIAAARQQAEKSARMSAAIAAVIYSTLADATESATNAFFDTINPSLSIEGYMQPVILGLPVGAPREHVHVRVDKTQVDVDLSVRLMEMLTRLSTQGILPVSPISDVTDVRVHVPFVNLYKDLFLGRVPTIDSSASAPWFAGLGSSLDVYGLELAQVQGLIFPGDVVLDDGTATTGAGYLLDVEHLLEIDPQGIDTTEIFVDNQLVDENNRTNWDKLQKGGILLDGRLTLPRFLTEPVELFTQIRDQLLTDLGALSTDCDDTISCVIAHPEETFAFCATFPIFRRKLPPFSRWPSYNCSCRISSLPLSTHWEDSTHWSACRRISCLMNSWSKPVNCPELSRPNGSRTDTSLANTGRSPVPREIRKRRPASYWVSTWERRWSSDAVTSWRSLATSLAWKRISSSI